VIPEASSTLSEPVPRSVTLSRIVWLASIVFCGVLPVLTLVALFASTIQDDVVAFDFRPFYRAAGAVLEGETPYPSLDDPLTASSGAYVYPPLTAIGAIPLRVLPVEAAGLLMMALLAVAALATPLVLGVRDWRCLGLVFLWPPVWSAIQTGNLTLLLGLAAALAWRFRDRRLASSAYVGVTLAAKVFLWPLVVWLAATRRLLTAALACAIGAGLLVLSWAAIGFAGLGDYVDLMRRLQDSIGSDAYTTYIVALDLGAPPTLARGIWLVLGLGLLTGVIALGRRGDERRAFILAIAAALALTPIVWLHYFALLVVVVALAQPKLGVMWFVPLAMVVTPGSGHPSPFETSATLAIAALTVALALRASVEGVRPVGSDPEPAPVGASARAA
jgi:hypothetical protein